MAWLFQIIRLQMRIRMSFIWNHQIKLIVILSWYLIYSVHVQATEWGCTLQYYTLNNVHRILSSRISRNLAIFNLQLDIVSLDLQSSTCYKLQDLQLQESSLTKTQLHSSPARTQLQSSPACPVLFVQSCLSSLAYSFLLIFLETFWKQYFKLLSLLKPKYAFLLCIFHMYNMQT